MVYAPADRAYYDADSHIMELPDFLTSYADPALRDQIPLVNYDASLVTNEEVAEIVGHHNRHSDAHRNEQIALGNELIAKSKEIQALGAFDSADRTVALDMLGFKKQLIFATHSVVLPFHPSSKTDPTLRYGATRAHNRHMSEFCSSDDRLMGVGIIPLDDPERAIQELDWLLDNGLEAVWVPHRAPIGFAPGHVELEPFWARLAESNTPVSAACRWFAAAGAQVLEQQRASRCQGLDGRRRERAHQGRDRHASASRDVHQHAACRRCP